MEFFFSVAFNEIVNSFPAASDTYHNFTSNNSSEDATSSEQIPAFTDSLEGDSVLSSMNMVAHHGIKVTIVDTLVELSLDVRGDLNTVLVFLGFTLFSQPLNSVIVSVQSGFHRGNFIVTHLVQSF